MDRKLKSESLALVLLLVAFPVISIGTTHGGSVVWWIGLLCFVVGGVLPVWTRYMDHSADKPRDMGMEFDDRTS
ncbi:MAG: hypothetical protein J2P19_01280 [Pseudonocardia sp.]|nr:EmrB/QacA subfamily drug resistance transporter [Hyphomicrobiaceae bacterium]MBO0872001.1 hypothetical protein [Pseudonocardia sp.]